MNFLITSNHQFIAAHITIDDEIALIRHIVP